MKLLGGKRNRGGGKEKKSNAISTIVHPRNGQRLKNNQNQNQKRNNLKQWHIRHETDIPINLALQQNQPQYYRQQSSGSPDNPFDSSRTCGGSSFSYSKYGDDTTVDGNETLYDWSVADNAPSVGSAGEIFMTQQQQKQHRERQAHRHGKKKKAVCSKQRFSGNGGQDRYASSSDDDDGGYHHRNDCDYDDNEPNNLNPYAKLPDSPPPKKSTGSASSLPRGTVAKVEKAIIRKSKQKAKSPTKLKDRKYSKSTANMGKQQKGFDRSSVQVKPNIDVSAPVDVDVFIGVVTPVNNNPVSKENIHPQQQINHTHQSQARRRVPASENVEILIRANGETRIIEESSNISKTRILREMQTDDLLSINPDFNVLYDSNVSCDGDDATSASMLKLVDSTSLSARRISRPIQAFNRHQMSQKSADSMKCMHDLVSTNGVKGSDWLLNNNRDKNPSRIEKYQWELPSIQDNEIQRGNKYGMVAKKTGQRKKSIKMQMKNKLQLLVGSKQKCADSKVSEKSKIPKPSMTRQLSSFSMQPLTGIEEGFVKRDVKTKREISLEMGHRKDAERQHIHKNNILKQQLKEKESILHQKNSSIRIRPRIQDEQKSIQNHGKSQSDSSLMLVERQKNREKLQEWVMDGLSEISMENKQQDTSTCTMRIDNRSPRYPLQTANTSLPNVNKSFTFVTEFPDEDSSAQSLFTSSPPKSESNLTCVICKSQERSHLATPCMHFSFCEGCVGKLKQAGKMRCAVCDKPVSTFSKIFY